MRAAIALLLIGCAMKGDARPKPVELKNAPVTVTMNLPRHDPKRHLMLRIEGISVEGEVATWEVRVGNTVAGTLSTYGAEEQNGFRTAQGIPARPRVILHDIRHVGRRCG